jgi:hypothetical protein
MHAARSVRSLEIWPVSATITQLETLGRLGRRAGCASSTNLDRCGCLCSLDPATRGIRTRGTVPGPRHGPVPSGKRRRIEDGGPLWSIIKSRSKMQHKP